MRDSHNGTKPSTQTKYFWTGFRISEYLFHSKLQLKASFKNDDYLLWPGRFVNIVLTLTNQPDAIVVPAQSLQTSQQGQFRLN